MTTGIAKDTLNLRTGPSTEQSIVRVIQPNTELTVLGTSGDWLNVKAPDGAVGYVVAKYVDLGGAILAAQPNPQPIAPVYSTKALSFGTDILNVRSSPQLSTSPDNKIEVLQMGATILPLETDASLGSKVGSTQDQNLWVRVRTPSGKEGYVAAWIVQYYVPTPQAQSTPVQ